MQVRQVLLQGGGDFNQMFQYGYAIDGEHDQLLKLDVKALKSVKQISLSDHHCVPLSAVFIHTGSLTFTHEYYGWRQGILAVV